MSIQFQPPGFLSQKVSLEPLAVPKEVSKAGPLIQVLFGESCFPLFYHLSAAIDGRPWGLQVPSYPASPAEGTKRNQDSLNDSSDCQIWLQKLWKQNTFQNEGE